MKLRDNARGWKRVEIFIIVRMIRHHEIRGDGNEKRRRASTRNHSAGCHDYRSQRVTQIGICQKVMDNKMRKKNDKRIRKETRPTMKTVA